MNAIPSVAQPVGLAVGCCALLQLRPPGGGGRASRAASPERGSGEERSAVAPLRCILILGVIIVGREVVQKAGAGAWSSEEPPFGQAAITSFRSLRADMHQARRGFVSCCTILNDVLGADWHAHGGGKVRFCWSSNFRVLLERPGAKP